MLSSIKETSRFGESDGFTGGRLQQSNFFALKDADNAELRLKVKNLEAKMADRQAFNERNGLDAADKDALLVASMARGLTKENERLARELGVLKATMAEWKAQQQGQGRGKMDLAAEEATELKAAVKRLQDELMNKDNFYREREEANKVKLAMYDSVEKALKESEKESRDLKDEIAVLNAEIQGFKMKLSNQEVKMKNFAEERKDLTQEILELKNENQEYTCLKID